VNIRRVYKKWKLFAASNRPRTGRIPLGKCKQFQGEAHKERGQARDCSTNRIQGQGSCSWRARGTGTYQGESIVLGEGFNSVGKPSSVGRGGSG